MISLRKQNGNVMLAVLGTLALTALVGYSIVSFVLQQGSQDKRVLLYRSTVRLIKINLKTTADNYSAGKYTIEQNYNQSGGVKMACLYGCVGDCSNPVYWQGAAQWGLIMYNGNNTMYYDGRTRTTAQLSSPSNPGFDLAGNPCNTYPDNTCVIRAEIGWVGQTTPSLVLEAKFWANPSLEINLSQENGRIVVCQANGVGC